MEIGTIYESIENGQRKQAKDQIRVYGVSKFFVGYMSWLGEYMEAQKVVTAMQKALNIYYN